MGIRRPRRHHDPVVVGKKGRQKPRQLQGLPKQVERRRFGAAWFGSRGVDTTANLFEWVEDCWNKNHKDAPRDGSARTEGMCTFRVIRGGSFYYYSKVGRSSYRAKNPPGVKSYWLGFRVLRELD